MRDAQPDQLPLLLDKCFEATDRGLPVVGDLIEATLRFLQALRLQLPDRSPPATTLFHQTRLAKRAQLLGDSLASDTTAFAEPRNRERAVDAEPGDQPDPRLVAECSKDRGCIGKLDRRVAMTARHSWRCSSPAPSSRARSS